MILLVKYKDKIWGSQTSVRAGCVDTLKYEIFFRDNLKSLIDMGYNAPAKIKKQFEHAESVYQAQCDGTLTEERLADFCFQTDLGGFECLQSAKTPEEIDSMIETILLITEDRRSINKNVASNVAKVIKLLELAKDGESEEIIDEINSIHHII